MTEPTAVRNLDRYGHPALPWSRPCDAFTAPFSAPSAGPPPWQLYRLTPHTAVAVASAEPHGATRWEFAH
jgi:hypothetical protein